MNGQSQPRGSKAFRGVVDISIRLHRLEKSKTMTLDAESRFPTATPERLRAKLDNVTTPWRYSLVDQSPDTRQKKKPADTDARLLAAIAEAGREGITYEELGKLDGLSEDMAKRRLPDWYPDGKVDRHGSGDKGDPYRWFIPAGS
jgi:hypothetical protein